MRWKRIKAVRTVIRRDEHELDAEKKDMERALRLLRKHEEEKALADEELREIERRMRECIDEDGTLSLHALQQWRRYLPEALQRLRQAETTHRRSEVAAEQTTRVVVRRKAAIRAAEKVRDRLAKERRRHEERQTDKEIDADWLRRWRNHE
jgi:plasmid maintenance system killer protein